jgi:hypothetical protein
MMRILTMTLKLMLVHLSGTPLPKKKEMTESKLTLIRTRKSKNKRTKNTRKCLINSTKSKTPLVPVM